MRVLGVDPGANGALALLTEKGLESVRDMPVATVLRGTRLSASELDVNQVMEIVSVMQPDVCWMEYTRSHPSDSPIAAYTFGRLAGAVEAVVRSINAPFHFVSPQHWKRAMGLTIGSQATTGIKQTQIEKLRKERARVEAMRLFPASSELFRRVKDDGRAEAALIAAYGMRQKVKEGVVF